MILAYGSCQELMLMVMYMVKSAWDFLDFVNCVWVTD